MTDAMGSGVRRANYGGSDTISAPTPNDAFGLFRTLAEVRSESEEGQSWGITVEVPDFNQRSPNIYARITWGMGGTIHQTVFQVGNGLSFSVKGNFVRLEAAYFDQSSTITALVRGSISRDDCARLPAVTSVVSDNILTGTLLAIDLPAFTREIIVIPQSPGAAGITWTVQELWSLTFAPNEKMEWTPVSDTTITIENAGPTDTPFTIYCKLAI